MARQSAGLLVYRRRGDGVEVFLVHPGGPFWQKKDFGAWSIPKGEFAGGEDPLSAARREFHEETGLTIEGDFTPFAPLRQRGGKTVYAWLVEADPDAGSIQSITFSLEWPPGSGQRQEFPEIDRAGWFDLASARQRLLASQVPLLDELAAWLEP